MEILHTINILGVKIPLEEINLEEKEKRNSLVQKTPTTTFPFLQTEQGNISQSNSIIYYLTKKYKPELLGETPFEKAKILQWIEFANCEINKCNKSIIYPIFGWTDFNKENFDNDNKKIKELLFIVEKALEKNEYIVGNKMTMRKKLFSNINKWFEKIMNTPEAIKAYGKTVLCKNIVKPFTGVINRNKQSDENKKENKDDNKNKKGNKNNKDNKKDNKGKKNKNEENKKEPAKQEEKKEEPYVPSILELPRFNTKPIENNPLDALPPSKFDLEKFKPEFIKNTNKKSAMKNFWKNYDPEGYSLWYIEYNNEPNECVTLFRTCIIKGGILEQLQYFKKYCFGVLGVYGADADYKIRGCLLWRGDEIPQEMKNLNCFEKMSFRKLDYNQKKDQQLVHDYWTKIGEKEKVFKKPAIDTRYFY